MLNCDKKTKNGIIHLITEGATSCRWGWSIRGQVLALPEIIELLAIEEYYIRTYFIEIASSKYNAFFDNAPSYLFYKPNELIIWRNFFDSTRYGTMGKVDYSWPYGDAFFLALQTGNIFACVSKLLISVLIMISP